MAPSPSSPSLSAMFPATDVQTFVRQCAAGTLPPQPAVPAAPDEASAMARLSTLDLDCVDWDAARLPTRAPDALEWKAHLDQITSVLERRTFQRDADDLVQAIPLLGDTPCANSATGQCVGTCCWELITGLVEPIVLRAITPDPECGVVHEPLCVLCHRYLIADLLQEDKWRTTFVSEASEMSRPGATPGQHRALRRLQTFFNPRDCPDGYAANYMTEGRDGDLLVIPVAQLRLNALRAERVIAYRDDEDTLYRWRIVQDALRFNTPSNAAVRPPVPGETVAQMLDRNKRTMSVASHTARRDERRAFVAGFLLPYHRWVTRDVPFLWRPSSPETSQKSSWDINLQTLDGHFFAPPAAFGAELRVVLCHLTDASLHLSRSEHVWAQYTDSGGAQEAGASCLAWDGVCFDRILDPALHGHAEQAGHFGPLSSVRSSIKRQFTKSAVLQRCQGRSAKGMAMKKIVTREVEKTRQRGGSNKVIGVHRYQGSVLRTFKQLALCSLLGNYAFVGHEHRPLDHELRRRLHQVFSEPRYERWVVKLIHQCTHLFTASVREFMCYSISMNPPLAAHVNGLMQMDAYRQITEAALNEARAYFRRYLLVQSPWHTYAGAHGADGALLRSQSDLYHSFLKLPREPAFLQRYYVCQGPKCSLPCPHKFMRTKEAKKAMAPTEQGGEDPFSEEAADAVAEDFERDFIQATSKDYQTVVVRHRAEEVERDKADARNERLSGWRWKPDRFHKHLNVVFDEMDLRASDISYSRPWKLVVLFRPMRKRRAPGPGSSSSSSSAATAEVGDAHRQLLRQIVSRCGPVRAGDAMSRVVSFFPFLGVDRDTTDVLLDLLAQFRAASTTEKALQEIMAHLAQHRPYAHALMHQAYADIRQADDQHFTVLLPQHIAFHQLVALKEVYGAVVPQTACFVFCPGCRHIYSHLMDANTMYAKVFRFGLRNAESDPHTGRVTCKRKLTKKKTLCGRELVQVPLVGRALFFGNKVVMICPQPRCARFMVLDYYDRQYTSWTNYGPACCACMPLMLHTVNVLRKMDEVYLNKGMEQGACCLRHEHLDDKRASPTQLVVLMHGVVVCKRHYLPEMGERAAELWTSMYGTSLYVNIQHEVREMAHSVHDQNLARPATKQKRHRQLADRASNGGRRPRKRTRTSATTL